LALVISRMIVSRWRRSAGRSGRCRAIRPDI
jgi:hypothetical protein